MITKKEVGSILKACRKKLHFSVDDSVAALKEENIIVAPKTIYSWESGNSMPGADTFLVLCKIYKINDIISVFFNEHIDCSQNIPLELIQKYRQLDADGQKEIIGIIGLKLETIQRKAEAEEANCG